MKHFQVTISITSLIALSFGTIAVRHASPDDLYLPFVVYQAPAPTATPTSIATSTITPTETSEPFAYIEITELEFDPPGEDLQGEFVVISNQGGANENMTGWKLKNEANETYRFPTFILKAGATVTVWTKAGLNIDTDLYWGSEMAIWNDQGDCATLLDETYQLVDWYCY
jgi:hypothetical protein